MESYTTGFIISIGWETKDPTTVFIFEDADAAESHAKIFCRGARVELDKCSMAVVIKINDRSFRWIWDWPRPTSRPWHYRFAGIEISTLSLHCHLKREERDYLFARVRGIPLSKAREEQFHQQLNIHTRDYNNEVRRLYQATP